MNRRTFLNRLVAGTAATALAPAWMRAAPAPPDRPNVLWIMTDQQFADAMSCAGADGLATPAMDRLSARGVRFTNAYCTNPICVPSRSSMITGRYPHEVGVNFNLTRHELTTPSLGGMMRDTGYTTGYVGKWHIPMPNDDASWHGFDFIRHAEANGIDPLVAPASIDFLNRKHDRPWFLVSSFVNPHDICEWARMASGMDETFKNGPIASAPAAAACPPLPANFAIPAREPSVIRALKQDPAAARTYPTGDWDEAQWRQYRWAYYRLIEKADAEIGKILDALESSGQLDNTVVIFTSDHGDGMGAHQWNQKTLFYEECARVPFIIAGRGVDRPDRTDEETLVSTGLDIAATALDYAGTRLPEGYHGLSLRPAAESRPGPRHEFVVSENDLAPRYGHSGGVQGRMVRTPRYKYVVYSKGENPEQLFDLREDPGELNSLTASEEHTAILEDHRQLLRTHLGRTADAFEAAPLGG